MKPQSKTLLVAQLKLPLAIAASITLSMASGLTGCSLFSQQGTIGGLAQVKEQKADIQLAGLDHKTVRQEYKELVDLVDDKFLREQIERRIAAIYMDEGDNSVVTSSAAPAKSYYHEAIKSYIEVLEKYPNSPDNADVLYQLAKAYDMEGQQYEALMMLVQLTKRHPNYNHMAEAYFRMGDIYYNQGKYYEAEQAYLSMTKYDVKRLFINAYYMMGWSQYKQGNYKISLNSFAYVLDQVVKKEPIPNKSKSNKSKPNVLKPKDDQSSQQKQLASIGDAGLPLAKDTLHAMTLGMINTGGAEQIANIKGLKKKPYVWMVYEALGDFYLEKERYVDSAETFRAFVSNYKDSLKAPEFHSKLISAYIKGGFPHQALPEKQRFVRYYGLNSGYQGNPKGGIRADLAPTIKTYIEELAKYYHAKAQKHQQNLKSIDPKFDKKKFNKIDQQSIAAYSQAADFYQQFIDSFTKDKQIPHMIFLKAEAYFSSRQYAKAITDYEIVAYDASFKGKTKQAANAGYAAIVSYQKHIDVLRGKQRKPVSQTQETKKWQQQAVASMLNFAATFHKDPRSTSVLSNAAEYLFGLNEYERALQVSGDLIKNNAKLDPLLKKTAYGIMAHSLFNMKDYLAAQQQYQNQRDLSKKHSKEYNRITERLAASLYRHSEELIGLDKKAEAVKSLLQIKTLAPLSTIRVTAQYDAASMLLSMQSWDAAIAELSELINDYGSNNSNHELAKEFPRKLAYAYEKSQQWPLAAQTYYELYLNDPDPLVRRDGLFLSAGFHEKAKNFKTAIVYYKRYANQYEKPFDNRMEARFHLAELYVKIKDKNKSLYWLRRIIDGDKKGGDKRTDRSRWLGAWANVQYGDYFASEFKRRNLYQPLEKSLTKKNQFLRDATTRYQLAAEYDIFEFVTLSSYKMAGLYAQFAQELQSSPRPKDLSEADKLVYEQIINEQVDPFLTLAASLHQGNIDRAWQGQFDKWINMSFSDMAQLSPERYGKQEVEVSYGDELL